MWYQLALFFAIGVVIYRNQRKAPRQYTEKNFVKQPVYSPRLSDYFSIFKIPNSIDIIVIGSGISGLCTAALLSRCGKRVLVLEKHSQIGGCCHEYTLSGFQFNSGIHYVGQADVEIVKLLECISTKPVEFSELGNEENEFLYDELHIGAETFKLKAGVKNYRKELFRLFPKEKTNINNYLKSVYKIAENAELFFKLKVVRPKWLAQKLQHWFCDTLNKASQTTVTEALSGFTNDITLRCVLSAQFPDYCDNPNTASFAMHAFVVKHFMEGGFVFKNGVSQLIKNILPTIRGTGGRVLTHASVAQILTNFNTKEVVGVRLDNGFDILCETVVSAVGLDVTFNDLLLTIAPPCVLESSASFVSLNAGFKNTSWENGFQNHNQWIYPPGSTPAESVQNFMKNPLKAPIPYLLTTSNKQDDENRCTVTIIALADPMFFAQWSNSTIRTRPKSYLEFKSQLEKRLLDCLFEKYPDSKSNLVFSRVSTPLSMEYYLNQPTCGGYGIKANQTHFQTKNDPLRPQTEVKGLFLTGADILTLGFAGALQSGLLTANAILEYGTIMDIIENKNLLDEIKNLNVVS